MSHSWFNRYFNLKNKKEKEIEEGGREEVKASCLITFVAVDKAVRVSRYYLLRDR